VNKISSRWIILAVLFASRTGLGFQFQTLGSVSDDLVDIFHFNYAEIGMLIGAFLLPGVVLALPCGFAGRYTSDRLLVTVGLVCLALGGVVAIIATSFNMFAFARIVCGIGFVVTTIYFTKMVADWFDGKELATAMAVLVMSWPFGIAMGQVGHVWLAALFDWRMAFVAASIYCCLGALGVFCVYRMPTHANDHAHPPQWGLPGNELTLTLLASLVWALFNAGYIVYLSFGASVLINGGYEPTGAAAIISLASWVMLFSGAICGQISDRFKKPDTILYICLAGGIASLLLLPWTQFAVGLSLLFGLIGMAPAGVIMALTTQAMAPHRRAFGIGVFFSSYFFITTPAPGIAGWLFDTTGIAYWPIVFAATLFLFTGIANAVFRYVQARLPKPTNASLAE
jgi:predicted MFS family arabinose efflux permease